MNILKSFWETLKEAFTGWNDSSAMRDAASLAYYAIFAMPGLLIIIIWIAGNFFGEEAITGEVSNQISHLMGEKAAESVEDLIASSLIDRDNIFMKVVGVGTLIFGATTIFFQLQISLNALWDVKAAPKRAIKKYLMDRTNSLGMILVIGFLMMIMMIMSSVISFLNDYITTRMGLETYILMQILMVSYRKELPHF